MDMQQQIGYTYKYESMIPWKIEFSINSLVSTNTQSLGLSTHQASLYEHRKSLKWWDRFASIIVIFHSTRCDKSFIPWQTKHKQKSKFKIKLKIITSQFVKYKIQHQLQNQVYFLNKKKREKERREIWCVHSN